MSKNNVPRTPSHTDPDRKKKEDQRPDTMKTNRHPTPDKAHDPQRNADDPNKKK